MVMLATSLGFTNDNGLETPAGVIVFSGIPSITINGLEFPAGEAPPLILIFGAASGDPPLVVILTPAALPVSNWSVDTIDPLLNSFSVTVVTEPVASLRLTVP